MISQTNNQFRHPSQSLVITGEMAVPGKAK